MSVYRPVSVVVPIVEFKLHPGYSLGRGWYQVDPEVPEPESFEIASLQSDYIVAKLIWGGGLADVRFTRPGCDSDSTNCNWAYGLATSPLDVTLNRTGSIHIREAFVNNVKIGEVTVLPRT